MTNEQFQQELDKLKPLLQKVAEMDIPKEHLPFLIVVTEQSVPLRTRLEMLREQWDEDPYVMCSPKELKSLVCTPALSFYLAVNIEDGSMTTIQLPPMGVMRVSVPKRSCLTVDEGVALITHKQGLVSSGHGIFLRGSQYNGHYHKGQTPFFQQYIGEFDYGVELNHTIEGMPLWINSDDLKIQWGTPSCKVRLPETSRLERLSMNLPDRLVLEFVMSLANLHELSDAIHLALACVKLLLDWSEKGYKVHRRKDDFREGLYLGPGPASIGDIQEGPRDLRVLVSLKDLTLIDELIGKNFADNKHWVVRRAVHLFHDVLQSSKIDGFEYFAEKKDAEPIKLDLLPKEDQE